MKVNLEHFVHLFKVQAHKCVFILGQVMRLVSNILQPLNLNIELPHSSSVHVHPVIKMYVLDPTYLLDNSIVGQVAKSIEMICINEELREIMKRYMVVHVELG